MSEVKNKSPRYFLGRNGLFTSVATDLLKTDQSMLISPITSKGLVGRCAIAIDEESVVDFVHAVMDLYPEKFELPSVE